MATWATETQDAEILNMARFKLGETARRLRALAEGATDPAVRESLCEMSRTLLSQQRALEHKLPAGKRPSRPADREEHSPPVRRAG